jgi:hypothetical protein
MWQESVGRVVDEKTSKFAWGIACLSRREARVEESCCSRFMPLISSSLVKGDHLINYFWRAAGCCRPGNVHRDRASSHCIDERRLVLEIGMPAIEGAAAAT